MSAPVTDAATALVIEEARRICEVPAPPFGEGPRGDLVAGLLADAGLPIVRADAGNVVAELGAGDPADAVIFAAHLDTVFAADTEIAFVERDGRLAAPGIGDNSVAVAALLHLGRRLRDRRLVRPVLLAATVGEEGLGDLRGAKALLDERPCAAFVAIEGQTLDTITIAAVGSLRFALTVRGPGGHPWRDRGHPSAIHALLQPLDRVVRELADAGLAANVGLIGGGTAINAIAAQASAELDVRSEDEAALEDAAAQVRSAFSALAPGLQAQVRQLGHRPGGRLKDGHPLLAAARLARERVGLPPAPERASSTDANAALGRGIAAICVGVTTGGNAHRLDEYIELAPITAGLASLEALVDELAGPEAAVAGPGSFPG